MHATQIDGVPVLWVPAQGPLRARLSFRLGTADETLVCYGLTRLAAHAAAAGLAGLTAAHRVTVAETRTCFDVAGGPEEVVTALASLTQALGALRPDRVVEAKAKLRSEGAPVIREHGVGRMRELDRVRFGPRGFGLAGCPEFGLQWLAPAHVAAWARDCCTAGNAVLWLSGPPPAGLRLALPDGPRMVPPPAGFGVINRPTWLGGPGNDVALSAIGVAGLPLEAGVWWLRDRLSARLRRAENLKFEVAAATGWLGDGLSRLAVVVEGPAGVGPWVRDDLLTALDQVVEGAVPAADMERWARNTHATAFSAGVLARLDAAARAELLGEPDLAAQATPHALMAVSGEAARAAVAQCLGSTLMRLPEGVAMDDPRWIRLPRLTEQNPLPGRNYEPVPGSPMTGGHLVVGPEGVVLSGRDGQSTVRWATCEAVVAWPDGRRLLIGADDSRVPLDPRQWQGGQEAVVAVDTSTPPDRLVVMDVPVQAAPPSAPAAPVPAGPPADTAELATRSTGESVVPAEPAGGLAGFRKALNGGFKGLRSRKDRVS
jgi:hypothetical protein